MKSLNLTLVSIIINVNLLILLFVIYFDLFYSVDYDLSSRIIDARSGMTFRNDFQE